MSTKLYTITASPTGFHIIHVPSNTLIAVCPNVLIASKLLAVIMVAELDAPIVWTAPTRNVLGLGGRSPQGDAPRSGGVS